MLSTSQNDEVSLNFVAVNFHFLKKSRRLASFLVLSTSKIDVVSLNFVVLVLWTFHFWGSLAGLLRFGAGQCPHCTAQNFAQLDFFLARQKHRNQCTDVQNRTGLYLNTDHYIVEMKIRITLAATSQPGLSTPKFLQPNLTQWQRYNESVSSLYALTSHAAEPWKRFNDVMSSAANQCLSKADSRSKKDYISRGTWNLINRRQTFFSEGDREEVTSY